VIGRQTSLFSPRPVLPDGLRYEEDFLDAKEEQALVACVAALPLQEARYKEWAAKRRVVSYGGRYDFDRNVLLPEQPIPPFLLSLRTRAAGWVGIAAAELDHALVAEYRPGTQLGWHRDVPEFAIVVGVSLLGVARMRLRRYPHVAGTRERGTSLDLAPRSIYSLRGEARWGWQHAISPTKALRYSITFRTLRR
jgi:alkylated DNA repair dioxygenase AlkB